VSEPSIKRKIPGMVWIFIAFIPWILYWSLSAVGWNLQAVVLAFIASLFLNVYRVRIRKLMLMDAVTLLFFASNFAIMLLIGGAVIIEYSRLAVYVTLCGMAFGSIAIGNPFTYQYAKQDWPREYWDDPIFKNTNNIITALWGFIFLIDALSYQIGSSSRNIFLSVVIPNLLLGVGIVFSVGLPKWYPKKVLQRQLNEQRKGEWPPPSFTGRRKLGENEYDVAIVGSGISGLSCGALLAKRGLKVLVVEQHYLAGGYCTSFSRKGQSMFDAGVHDISGLGPRGAVRFLLHELNIEDRLQFKRVTSEYVLPDMRLQVPHDYKDFVDEIASHFSEEKENLIAFFAEMKGIYDDMYRDIEKRNGVLGQPETVDEMLKYPVTHPHLYRWFSKSYLEMLNSYFSNQRLKEILCTLTGYLTDDPKALKAFSMAPIFGYYFDGGYYPKGSSQALANMLVSVIKKNGGTVLLSTKVEHILVKDSVACGLLARKVLPQDAPSKEYKATVVISNADVKETFLKLVEPRNLPSEFLKRVNAMEPSTSAFAVFLSLNYDPPLSPLTFYLSHAGPSVLIAIPSKLDPDLAAPGGSAVTIITLMPNSEAKTWKREAPEYKARKESLMEKLIDKAAELIPDLRHHIVYKEAGTPATFHRYTSSGDGAIYGPRFGQQLGFKTPIRNLYLVGSGVFPGPGIEAVIISALIAANDILPKRALAKATELSEQEIGEH
jgi:phytoene dehydrogenase-like protein